MLDQTLHLQEIIKTLKTFCAHSNGHGIKLAVNNTINTEGFCIKPTTFAVFPYVSMSLDVLKNKLSYHNIRNKGEVQNESPCIQTKTLVKLTYWLRRTAGLQTLIGYVMQLSLQKSLFQEINFEPIRPM